MRDSIETKQQQKINTTSRFYSLLCCIVRLSYLCVFTLRRSRKSIHPKMKMKRIETKENNNHNHNIHSNIYMNIEQATNKSTFIANKMWTLDGRDGWTRDRVFLSTFREQ